jgi:uncharacterized protein YbaP (TraB family)
MSTVHLPGRSHAASRRLAGRVACLAAAVAIHAPPVRAGELPAGDVPPEITITGERPGPGLWRVTAGGHTLWLLGMVEPLPRRMTWRSATVDATVSRAQAVLPARASVKVNAGPFATIALYFKWRSASRLAGSQTLREVLPAPLYARFDALRRRYAPNDASLEHLRPALAAQRLFERALATLDMRADRAVERSVLATARRAHVPIEEAVVAVEDPKAVLAELAAIPPGAEAPCVEATVGHLEHDLPALRVRATAWASGDVETLRALPSPASRAECWDLVELSPRLKALAAGAREARWRRVEAALAAHESTFAMVPMDQLLAADGLLARLKARGDVVDGP